VDRDQFSAAWDLDSFEPKNLRKRDCRIGLVGGGIGDKRTLGPADAGEYGRDYEQKSQKQARRRVPAPKSLERHPS
jgi:hypothetical protein